MDQQQATEQFVYRPEIQRHIYSARANQVAVSAQVHEAAKGCHKRASIAVQCNVFDDGLNEVHIEPSHARALATMLNEAADAIERAGIEL